MSIASELTNLEGNIEDSYDAVNDMGGIIPAQRNMDNLDQAIRTIPQNQGTTYTAGTGIDITNDVISVDNTTVPFFTDLATVATTGDYGDLLNTPTIPAAQVNSDWNANSGVAQILNKPSLATVATSGLYSDLTGTPSLATVATSGDYDDLLNKPTIPTVNDATLTIQHNGTTVQTFTANQSTNATANIETIWADDIEATTPVPSVETDMIADGAVTPAKLSDTGWVNANSYINTTYFAPRANIYYRILGGVVYWSGEVYCHTAPGNDQQSILVNLPLSLRAFQQVNIYGSQYMVSNSDYSIWTELDYFVLREINQNIPATSDYQGYNLGQMRYISSEY